MPFEYTGNVVPGKRLGRELGFPTANIPVEEGFEAPDGVYAATAVVEGKRYLGMANLGRRPSVGGSGKRTLEIHLFDFTGDLYGNAVTVRLEKYIRPEERFPTVKELRRKIGEDRLQITEYFKIR